MKKTFFTFIILLTSILSWGQVTTNPTFITQTGCAFDIIFDASTGSAGLKGLTSGVYTHIGVITSKSTSSSDWKYVLTPWPNTGLTNLALANTSKNTLTNIGTNLWKLTIGPDIQTFLGVPSTEKILQIALVFRNADGSKTGKTASGGDILVNVYTTGLNVLFTNPSSSMSVTAGTSINIQFGSSIAANLNLLINGTSVQTATSASTLSYNYTFATANDYTLIAQASLSGVMVADTVQVCVPAPVTDAARPSLPDGINYIDNSTVTLIMYAPGKNNVFVIGDFNNWTQLNSYQMKRDGNYWWLTISGLTSGKLYGFQYLVDGTMSVSDPYTELVLDPWNDQWINQYTTIFPNLKPYPVGKTTGLVATLQTAKTPYNWQIPSFTMPSKENMVIYELLLRDFTTQSSLNGAIGKLDYLKNLGVTAVELMPIQEFDGNNSWGYNPNHYFAPDKTYGTPDTYKKFIDECHKRGMAVILDMVFNQATGLCPFAALYWDAVNNRPATNNPWMNPIAPHPYSVLNDFNHSFSGTKQYFERVLQYWITEYHVDGYRMDLAKGFTQNVTTGEPAVSNYDQSRVNNLTDYYNAAVSVKSDVMFILEFLGYGSNSDGNAEENKYASEGIYLWRNMNYTYCQSAMGYQSGSDFSSMITTPRQWVGYGESHDEERTFYKALAYGAGGMTTDSVARINRVPLNLAFVTLLPGPKMIYEFEEMGYDYSINWGINYITGLPENTSSDRTYPKQPAWNWLNLPLRKAADDASAKIMTLRKMYPNVFTQGTYSINVGANDWSQGRRIGIVHNDLDVVVLGNFDPTNTVSANPTFPKTGVWYNYMTGDAFPVSNPYMTISMTPGQLLIFTDRQVVVPNGVSIPKYDSDCTVYPTATNGLVYVSSTNLVQNVQVYNMQGMVVLSNSNINSKEIDLSKMMNGLYIMEVTTLQGKSRYKIIKD